MQRPGKKAGANGLFGHLTSERGFQAKTVPETTQALSKKARRGEGLSSISKIRFCRFHGSSNVFSGVGFEGQNLGFVEPLRPFLTPRILPLPGSGPETNAENARGVFEKLGVAYVLRNPQIPRFSESFQWLGWIFGMWFFEGGNPGFANHGKSNFLFKVGLRPCSGAFEKVCRGPGFDRISKIRIRFCRFHRVSLFRDINTVFEGCTQL